MKSLDILFIDFFDSFSYNLAQVIMELGHKLTLKCFNESVITPQYLDSFDLVVLGPGPGHVSDYKEFIDIVALSKQKQSFLGICLGHQMLGHLSNYDLLPLKKPLHGISLELKETYEYLKIGSEAKGMFYNSWTLGRMDDSIGFSIEEQGQISLIDIPFGLGIQFHPESVGSSFPNCVLDSALKTVYNKKNEGAIANNWDIRPANHSASQ